MVSDEVVWERSPHTAIKHQILENYLGAWFAKLAWSGRLLFIDGFAGPGRYRGGEEGSPLIALRIASDHPVFRPGTRYANCERTLVFIEENQSHFAHLQYELSQIRIPAGVNIVTSNVEFEHGLTDVLDRVEGRGRVPSFVMIDPFGWTGFPYSIIRRLGGEQRGEILVSFMYESINRFLGHPQQEANWNRLFGSEDWRNIPPAAEPDERRRFLTSLYAKRVGDAGFVYQWKFELRDERNRPEYYLMFGTHSIEGLAAMKESMWRVAPDGTYRYSDYEQGGGQMKLVLGDPHPEVLARMLRQRFAGRGEIERKSALREFTLVETDFIDKHLTESLRFLERRGAAHVRRPPGRRSTFFNDVWVMFN